MKVLFINSVRGIGSRRIYFSFTKAVEQMLTDRISEVYSLGDVALISCKPGIGNAGMPSKTWSIMACNTPIIVSFDTDSDLADAIRDSGAGKCVEPGDVQKLVDAIKGRYQIWKSGLKEAVNLRLYVEENASKEKCVERYMEVITSACFANRN